MKTKDERPEPKPRYHPQLWQSYLWWHELVEMRKRHTLRISSIERGKSNMDAGFEYDLLDDMRLDAMIEQTKKTMINYGKAVGPIWDWLIGIKGIGDKLAAQLLARIDYIGPTQERPDNFATVSKLWRFAGFAVIDGKAEKSVDGETRHYDGKLKGICWNIVASFIKQQTPVYVDIYYAEKARQRQLHPEKIKVNGKWKYNDGHLHRRAWRKMIKAFLKDLWLKWRELEGLPLTEPFEHSKT